MKKEIEKKWKPKKFISGVTIDPKTGKTISKEYVYPETEEEEKQWEREHIEKLGETWETILGEELFGKIGTYLESVRKKYGEKEYQKRFKKLWNELFTPTLNRLGKIDSNNQPKKNNKQ